MKEPNAPSSTVPSMGITCPLQYCQDLRKGIAEILIHPGVLRCPGSKYCTNARHPVYSVWKKCLIFIDIIPCQPQNIKK